MSTITSAVVNIMQMFAEEFGPRFITSESKFALWEALLAGFPGECILAAGTHIVATGGQWPPTIGQVREQCIEISEGRLERPSGEMAWVKVLAFCADKETLAANSDEMKALKAIGGSWQVNHTTNPDATRAQFVRAFDAAVSERRNEQYAIPAVSHYLTGVRAQLNGTSIAQITGAKEQL